MGEGGTPSSEQAACSHKPRTPPPNSSLSQQLLSSPPGEGVVCWDLSPGQEASRHLAVARPFPPQGRGPGAFLPWPLHGPGPGRKDGQELLRYISFPHTGPQPGLLGVAAPTGPMRRGPRASLHGGTPLGVQAWVGTHLTVNREHRPRTPPMGQPGAPAHLPTSLCPGHQPPTDTLKLAPTVVPGE